MAPVRRMSGDSERCPECGSPKSSWLEGNCPTCLMRLGATPQLGEFRAAAPSHPDPPPVLGSYELVEEIARGGMGIVYRARQLTLKRAVALKVLPGGRFADKTFIQRFHREAQAAASLNHPNIVSIHEVGEQDGQLFFSMDLIEGRSLAEVVRDNPLPAQVAAQIIQMVAEAVSYAHSRGVLHRDLKPSNVLLDENGVPHVTDFGLAKRSDDEVDLTLTGQIVGSPNYMAPEQADPRLGPTTAASDVYSLGAMLYHLLTGRPPFMAESVAQTLRFVLEGDPVLPSLLYPGVSLDLQTVCLKCLETNPAARYQSAQELAADLGRYIRHEPIRARPVGVSGRLVRWCRRNPSLAASLAGIALLLLLVAIGSPIALVRIYRERQITEAARQQESFFRLRAEAGQREARHQLYAALAEQANALVHSGTEGQRFRALDAARRAAAISNSVDLRRSVLAALSLPDLHFQRQLPVEAGTTLAVMDPFFKTVALGRGGGPVQIRAVSDWQLLKTLPATTNLPAYVGWWSPDRHYLAIKRDASSDGERADLELWTVEGQQRVVVLNGFANQALSFHPTQPRLLAATVDGTVVSWDLEKAREAGKLHLRGTPTDLKFAPDGERFAAVSKLAEEFAVAVYDTQSGSTRTSHRFTQLVSALDWHPGGRWIAVTDHAGTVRLMDAQTGEVRPLGSHKAQAVSVVFSPDGDFLWSGGWEGELICWDMRTFGRSLVVERQGWRLQLRADGFEYALHNGSGIQLFTFAHPFQRTFAEDLGPRLRRATFSLDGEWLAASADQRLGVWNLNSRAPGTIADGLIEARPSFTVDGPELLASGSNDKYSRWNLIARTNGFGPVLQPAELPPLAGHVSLATLSNQVVLTGELGSRIFDLKGIDSTNARWSTTGQGINGISPDGKWLAIYRPFSPLLQVYALPEITPVTTLTNRGNIRDFVFTPTSEEVAVSSLNGVKFWSTRTWEQTRLLTNFTGILCVPDGSGWWLTSDFSRAGLYEAKTLEPLLPLPVGTLPLALSPDGRHLAVSVEARKLQVWDLEELRRKLAGLGLDWKTASATR